MIVGAQCVACIAPPGVPPILEFRRIGLSAGAQRIARERTPWPVESGIDGVATRNRECPTRTPDLACGRQMVATLLHRIADLDAPAFEVRTKGLVIPSQAHTGVARDECCDAQHHGGKIGGKRIAAFGAEGERCVRHVESLREVTGDHRAQRLSSDDRWCGVDVSSFDGGRGPLGVVGRDGVVVAGPCRQ